MMEKKKKDIRKYIITAVYNRRIDEIRSLPVFERLLQRHTEAGWIIADNSTDQNILERNRLIAKQKNGLRYFACGGNIGLSRAYNRALAEIPKEGPYWVMLSDDDTLFSMEYLENGFLQIDQEERISVRTKQNRTADAEFREGVDSKGFFPGREPLRMLCGVVRTAGGWISPRSEHTKELAFSHLLKQPKPGIYRDLYPINSGLFLSGRAIREAGGFDERLFLDQVDFLMMDRLRERGIRRIGVLPGEIRQEFSGELSRNRETAKGGTQSSEERWKIFRKDFETYCELTKKPWCYRAYLLGRRRLMLDIQRLLRRR